MKSTVSEDDRDERERTLGRQKAAKANGEMFRRKVGAAVIAVRRGGAIHAFNSINHFFFISQMVVPGSSYWNLGIGRDVGEVEEDPEGLTTMKNLGLNMAWLLRKLTD